LGLIERKERPKVKEEPSPEHGSQLYQTEYTETKRFEHEAFLAEVVGKPAGGKHIAIIGEPGAGKTTILTKIGAWLIQQAEQQPPAPLVVAWLSLADVGDRRLQEYLRAEWLQKVCEDNFDVAWEEWKGLRQQGRVWLLLDGLDEMSGDALAAIHRDLGLAWAQNLRVVMTCRINQWETAAGGNVLTNSFDVYRTLDYSYQTSQGDDQVKEFISKWFADNQKVANQIRTELDAPGKERIKDLVKNPLRLTLLCASWEKDSQALPETKANLYRGFVNYLYKWKAAEFSDEVKLRQELDLALGELAKAGLNRAPINDGAVRRFRFTASEISELWADLPDTLLPAAKNLGWLNVVGEEATEAVYAFYHPTFQEYFAACSIDDWDYFLPRAHIDRPVPCQGEFVPTYRVFEQQWQQVILLWIGRSDLRDEFKEEFIEKLTNFKEQENYFYYYRAYCMAAICVGEFKSSWQSKLIIYQLIRWAFGYFNAEQKAWIHYLYSVRVLAKKVMFLTFDKYIVENVTDMLAQEISRDNFHWQLTMLLTFLTEIATGAKQAISVLTEVVKYPSMDKLLRGKSAEALGMIDIGNNEAITALVKILIHDDFESSLHPHILKSLSKIGTGNQQAIASLIALSERSDLENKFYLNVVESLGIIGVGNQQAIDSLVRLLEQDRLESQLCYKIAEALGKVDPGNQKAFATLIKLLEDLELSENFIGLNDLICSYVSNALIEIAIGDRSTISSLIKLLRQNTLNKTLCSYVAEVLRKIGIGNQEAIASLVELLEHDDLENSLRYHVAVTLGTIDIGNQKAIDSLVKLLERDDLEIWFRYSVAEKLGTINIGNHYSSRIIKT
jgi:HEAT repeat protein/energy-coupling factor transporter ATP-binding protein EcfA2